MEDVIAIQAVMSKNQSNNITGIIKSFSSQLLRFIKKRVAVNEDAEDILQEVFYQFAGAEEPITQVTGWLYKVARNKITDNYRKTKLPLIDDLVTNDVKEDGLDWKEILMASDHTPETSYIRNLFWEELQLALDELPTEQSEVFIQNEMEGIAFKDIAEITGVNVATLISRKRYAVLHLRERLGVLRNEILNY